MSKTRKGADTADGAAGVLSRFSESTRTWFDGAFPAPTPAQLGAWDAISSGAHTLVVAPTGSGKTLSAFLWALDRLASRGEDEPRGTRVLYISPLKALAVDVERNLRAPLVGITQTAKLHGLVPPQISVGVRSGDTTPADRRLLIKTPPDILITTPESLFLMLTSAARETLESVDTIIVDEVHAVAGTKRGAHLALSLERLDAALQKPAQRIGLSATVRPHEEVGRFLTGSAPIRIVAPPSTKTFELSVRVPVEDMTELGTSSPQEGSASAAPQQGSIWPHVEEQIVDMVLEHRSSIVFANSRRLSEKLTARLNEIYSERLGEAVDTEHAPPSQVGGASDVTHGAETLLARAHHGSVSKDQRAIIEDDLKSGRLRCVVATSSLELGIDMGAVDLVVQVEAPPSVASGLQRVGRAGHQVGEVSRGVLFPKHRTDLVHCAVTVQRMADGQIEALKVPTNPLDILAQHTVAACALEPIDADEWFDSVRRTGNFASLPRSAYESTLDLLSGRYPSDEFAELRPRLVWDRETGSLTGRPGAQRLAVTSGGAIPDRGMFTVFMVGERATRVGELDEEMVYESRVGDVFALGATSWRIEEITHDRVLVSPAFGVPGRLPFWHGDGPGRPAELGEALGGFLRESSDEDALRERLVASGLDVNAVTNLVSLLAEQRAATGNLPTDKTLVVERFRDELGDWRLILHSPYGQKVHAPWALAVGARLIERFGIDSSPTASDDGIIVRLPDTEDAPPGAELFVFDRDEIADIVTEQVGGSALFASRFRECAARALLLPRRNPGKRAPLWQQRQRAAQLLDVAKKYPSFPILLETVRECLQDVYDLPALEELCTRIARRQIRVIDVETDSPSPFATSLLFSYVGQFMYEGDSPLAERRAAALTLDASLLAELLGRVELRDLLDGDVVTTTEAELQRLPEDRRARDVEGVADLLRILGPLTTDEVVARTVPDGAVPEWLQQLVTSRRAMDVSFAGSHWWVAIEDASRLRDGLGVPLPIGVPDAFIEPVDDPMGDLVSRYARTHGPFTTADVASRFGIGAAVARDALHRLAAQKRVVEGEFRPGATGSEWCDAEVLRRLRRRSLAAARHDVEPVSVGTLGRFLPSWQHVGGKLHGIDGVATVVEQLAGVPVPASAWESLIFPSRVRDYSPAMLDELTATGEVLWSGHGAISSKDGWVCLHTADAAPLTLTEPPDAELTDVQERILGALAGGGAYFFRQLSDSVQSIDDDAVVAALWDLVWTGRLTNDTFAPLRALLHGSAKSAPSHRQVRRTPRTRSYRRFERPSLPTRTGPPSAGGRWALLPEAEHDLTVRAKATADIFLERYGVVTRGSVMSEGVPGGFGAMYKVLSTFEDSGRARRGYFVDSLGGAQFSTSDVVDRLRNESERTSGAVALAATDPANPFGAALTWPKGPTEAGSGHRPGRKAGAIVVLVEGDLVLYVERGGKSVLTFTEDRDVLQSAAAALGKLVTQRSVDRILIERTDGSDIHGSVFASILTEAGFSATPRGLRIRA
ncbi:DEAD/DEAH box helicase [Rhodococcoides trifolii]|uniref:DEAD/DEAH box helicase n=1 Tax=Rhodococcoides trifolii TaxID=908250 RepID=A0A917D4W3_9NOCA|nr:ATP-dependent helicase [Rhodococcus trifolii]GGG13045.1 DEAD/DEAH box helicase [Rhodococcus trifolii]